jgi:hypothetical protein
MFFSFSEFCSFCQFLFQIIKHITLKGTMSSQRLDQIASYFNEKEKRRLAEVARGNKGGLPEMTEDEIRLSCLENDGYDSPELNEKLYLHFRGFRKIENLDKYTGCKALWLDSNGLERIEGLDALVNMRCLYMAKNLISKVEGLECLVNLVSIDLSNNRIARIEGLSQCKSLKTINLSKNALSSIESIEHLVECDSVDNIDLTNNAIEGDVVDCVFSKMANLVSLSINGNPVTQTQSFRKLTIVAVPRLCYLDRPIDEVERLGAEAFVRGGVDAEKEARDNWREQQRETRKNEMENFRVWQREQYEQRKAAGLLGKSTYITEFTAGEKAEREMEAKKAAEDERRMLDLGIGRLGERFWQMQGQAGSSGEDPLQMAVDSLLQEEERKKSAAAVVEELDDVEESVGAPDASAPAVDVTEDVAVGVEEITLEDAEEVAVEQVPSVAVEQVPSVAVEQVAESVDEEVLGEEESQDIRDQRVAESLEIWRRQQQALKDKKQASSSRGAQRQEVTNAASAESDAEALVSSLSGALSSRHKASTWESAQSAPARPTAIYWTEWMDIKLAELVRICVFDFAAIANTFRGFSPGELPGVGLPRHDELCAVLSTLSEEACRVRWAELDARRWSADDDDAAEKASGDAPPVYRVCIQPDVLGKGHGAQPSFQAMASMASGSMPSYLKVPSAFPSTAEFADDDDTDNDDVSLERLD